MRKSYLVLIVCLNQQSGNGHLAVVGISGPCDMDDNGDRLPYFWFFQYFGEHLRRDLVAVSEDKNRVR